MNAVPWILLVGYCEPHLIWYRTAEWGWVAAWPLLTAESCIAVGGPEKTKVAPYNFL